MKYFNIDGFPDYRLVRLSERDFYVESRKKGEWERRGHDYGDGHIGVYLAGDNGVKRYTYLHVIIAELFVPNPEGKPIVHHIDWDPTNNDPANNLMWVTASEHRAIHNESKKGSHHSDETKLKMSERQKGRKPHWLLKPVEQWSKDGKTLIARYESMHEAARQTGVNISHISDCCNGRLKQYKGYKWSYQPL